jgi:large subunit ribosomal protein L23
MQLDARQIIIRPVISEQSYDAIGQNVYTFEVHKSANKIEIARAVEQIFDVTVTKVNTLNVKPKIKRLRYKAGATRTWKKAMVTLAEGDSIEIFGA